MPNNVAERYANPRRVRAPHHRRSLNDENKNGIALTITAGNMNEFWKDLVDVDSLYSVERAFDLEVEHIFNLANDADWIMIVKLHAIIESVSNYALSARLKARVANVPIDYSALDKFVSRLEMSNTKYGKLALLKAFDLISDEMVKRMQSLSELRNRSIHDIRGTSLNINNSVSQMAPSEFAVFRKRWITPNQQPLGEVCDIDDESIMNDPKGFIHACACDIISEVWSYSEGMIGLIEIDDLFKSFGWNNYDLMKGDDGDGGKSESP